MEQILCSLLLSVTGNLLTEGVRKTYKELEQRSDFNKFRDMLKQRVSKSNKEDFNMLDKVIQRLEEYLMTITKFRMSLVVHIEIGELKELEVCMNKMEDAEIKLVQEIINLVKVEDPHVAWKIVSCLLEDALYDEEEVEAVKQFIMGEVVNEEIIEQVWDQKWEVFIEQLGNVPLKYIVSDLQTKENDIAVVLEQVRMQAQGA